MQIAVADYQIVEIRLQIFRKSRAYHIIDGAESEHDEQGVCRSVWNAYMLGVWVIRCLENRCRRCAHDGVPIARGAASEDRSASEVK